MTGPRKVQSPEDVVIERLTLAVDELKQALGEAIARLADMHKGDDGQAWKEAGRALPRLRATLARHKKGQR